MQFLDQRTTDKLKALWDSFQMMAIAVDGSSEFLECEQNSTNSITALKL